MTKTTTKESAELFEQEVPAPEKPGRRSVPAKIVVPPPTNMLAIIANAAANPQVDVGKMRELLTMQREIMAEEARIAFTQAFVDMELPSIGRDGKIDEGITKSGKQGKKTRYATFESINATITPLLKQNGFSLWFEPDIGLEGRVVLRGHLDHVRGHGKTCSLSLPLETQNKNNLQGAGSSISYMKRYATMALLNIQSHAPEDLDIDGSAEDASETINGSQAKKLIAAIDECGIEATRFMDKYKIKAVHELPTGLFDEAMKACKDYGERARDSAAN